MSHHPFNPAVHCRDCLHYYITHEPDFPYGCRAMSFKSKRLPLLEVRDSTGRNCVTFSTKPARQPRSP